MSVKKNSQSHECIGELLVIGQSCFGASIDGLLLSATKMYLVSDSITPSFICAMQYNITTRSLYEDICADSLDRGRHTRHGVVENGDFQYFRSLYIFGTFRDKPELLRANV